MACRTTDLAFSADTSCIPPAGPSSPKANPPSEATRHARSTCSQLQGFQSRKVSHTRASSWAKTGASHMSTARRGPKGHKDSQLSFKKLLHSSSENLPSAVSSHRPLPVTPSTHWVFPMPQRFQISAHYARETNQLAQRSSECITPAPRLSTQGKMHTRAFSAGRHRTMKL